MLLIFQLVKMLPVAIYYYQQAGRYSSYERPEHEPLDPMHLRMESYMKHNGDIFVLALAVCVPKHLKLLILCFWMWSSYHRNGVHYSHNYRFFDVRHLNNLEID